MAEWEPLAQADVTSLRERAHICFNEKATDIVVGVGELLTLLDDRDNWRALVGRIVKQECFCSSCQGELMVEARRRLEEKK